MTSSLTFTRCSVLQKLTQRSCRLVSQTCSIGTSSKYAPEEEQEPDEERALQYDDLYPGHIPTTLFQKVLLSAGSAAMSLYDPRRDDMISTLGETTGYFALKKMKQKMLEDPVGRQISSLRPEINTSTLSIDYLGSLPEETFGKKYWNFLSKNGFSPDARLPVHFVDDPELKYVMLRYRQTHDLFHSVLGMPPHMLGEVAVKWVEAIQTGLPMCALGAFFGPLRLGPVNKQQYLSTYLPWAIRCGTNSKFLMAVYWEKHWEQNLTDLRNELNIEPAPLL
ncbi:ubiquinone biosynthesis protein COQ4 [Mytilus galloprovincialis]|uniref:Ubiquinone biosynthesis protein COQ4 homolog, mitochondrial n=1 Tax=Mytilus galloprovincialis TaxID=29158 RepID=A0A8B6CL39_MYTGA|nr:ubiquinone biosynthesis protein COQ4 [Mytilus galloprovincialis]